MAVQKIIYFLIFYIPNNIYPVIRDDVEIGMYYVGVGAKWKRHEMNEHLRTNFLDDDDGDGDGNKKRSWRNEDYTKKPTWYFTV